MCDIKHEGELSVNLDINLAVPYKGNITVHTPATKAR